MKNILSYEKGWRNVRWVQWRSVFFRVFFLGFLIHFLGIAYDLLNHDSVSMFNAQSNYWLRNQGKWAAGYVISFLSGSFANSAWFTPMGIAFLAVSACIIGEMLNIKDAWFTTLIGIILVAFPAVVSFSIYYGTHYFAFTCMIFVFSAFLISRVYLGWIPGILLVALGMGSYQPYVGFAATLLVLVCLVDVLYTDKPIKKVWLQGIKYIACLLAGVAIYYLITQILIGSGYITATSYQGIDQLTSGALPSVKDAIKSIIASYVDIITYIFTGSRTAYPSVKLLYQLTGIEMIVLFIFSTFVNRNWRRPSRLIPAAALFFLVLPVAINLVSVLSLSTNGHSIMEYSFVLVFVIPLVLGARIIQYAKGLKAESNKDDVQKKALDDGEKDAPEQSNVSKGYKVCRCVAAVLCVCIALCTAYSWAHTDSDFYHAMRLNNQQLFDKANILIGAIRAQEEYTDEMPVVIVGAPYFSFLESKNSFASQFPVLAGITIGYRYASEIPYTTANLKILLNSRMGADFQFIDENAYVASHQDICDAMPIYPDQGSIQVVDNVLVVKLGK